VRVGAILSGVGGSKNWSAGSNEGLPWLRGGTLKP
jgi:hypothetical protein